MDFLGIEMEIPPGWEIESIAQDRCRALFKASDGCIEVRYYLLVPGVMLLDIDLNRHELPTFDPDESIHYTINWCVEGRCEVDFGTQGSTVVSEGMFCLSSTLAESLSYPTGRYRGFEYFIDAARVNPTSWEAMQLVGVNGEVLRERFMRGGNAFIIGIRDELKEVVERIEAELARSEPRHERLTIETLHLLMLLSTEDLEEFRVAGSYLQRGQRDMAREVYQQIVSSPSPTVNLDAFAERFGVSEASLRAYFSRMYGMSPAAFAREIVMREAAKLLRQTQLSVTDISLNCGYVNPSKFAAAFRRSYGVNPLEYRRRNSLSIGEEIDVGQGTPKSSL